MKKVAVTLVSLVALAMAAPAASAGEYTGSNNPKAGKAMGGEKAASICAYSGLDAPDDIENNPPGFEDDALMIHGVQNYGQFVMQGLKDAPGVTSPGIACRGHAGH